MMMHWSPRSPFVRKVMIALHETALIDRVECVRSRVPTTDMSLQIFKDNPVGLIPTLVPDGGEPVFGSAVILHYLDSLHGGPRLVPEEPAAKIWALRMQDIADSLLGGLIPWAFSQNQPPEIAKSRIGQTPVKFARTLDYLEARIAQFDAAPFNAGHIAIGTMLAYCDFRLASVDWRGGRPELATWQAAIVRRPSFAATEFVDEPSGPAANA